MNNEFEILQELQGVIKNAANTVSRLMEIKKEREAKTTELKRENDWEIECIVHGNKNYWRRKDGLYVSDLFVGGSGKDWLLNNGGTIFQVTRKSDGVVFSVGDEVEYRSSDWDNDMWWGAKINRIELSKTSDKKLLFILDDNEEGNSITKFIENIRPYKLPERTTEKPPIGVMPEYIWKEQRLYELNQAIIRYINAGLSYPKEWGFERENLINETKPKQ